MVKKKFFDKGAEDLALHFTQMVDELSRQIAINRQKRMGKVPTGTLEKLTDGM